MTERTFNLVAAQGDVIFRRMTDLPKTGLTPVASVDRELIVTHSETGHHHVMVLDRDDPPAVEMYQSDNPLISWLRVNRPTTLEHRRPHDTHAPIRFPPGIYEVRRQREYTPEGWRRVAD